MNRHLLFGTGLLAAALWAAPAQAQVDEDTPFAAVGPQGAIEAAPGATVEVPITVHVLADHYLYASAMSVELGEGASTPGAQLPDPVVRYDKWEDHDVAVYPETFTLQVPVVVPGDAQGALSLSATVGWRGCNESMCFFPTREEVAFQLAVSGDPVSAGDSGAGESPVDADTPFAPTGAASFDLDGDGELALTMHVLADHYLYASAMAVAVETPDGVSAGEAVLDDPVVRYDKWEDKDVEVYPQTFGIRVPLSAGEGASSGPVTVSVSFRGCNESMCFFPTTEDVVVEVSVSGTGSGAQAAAEESTSEERGSAPRSNAGSSDAGASVSAPRSMANAGVGELDLTFEQRLRAWFDQLASGGSFGLILLVSFLGGIAASLTPCVYPMIPITLAVIGAQATSRWRAFVASSIYVAGMTLVYALLGVVAAMTGGLVGGAFQKPWAVALIAAFFVVLALGMFGAYQFALPPSLTNRINSLAGGPGEQSKSGAAVAFIAGAVSGVVASPCVGPVAAGILGLIAHGSYGIGGGFIVMASFGLGLGMLFLVVGTFSASLPRSGPWMETIKYVFGFMLIGVSIFFLSNILPGIVIQVLWAGLFLVSGVAFGALQPLDDFPSWGAKFGRAFALGLLILGGSFVAQVVFAPRLSDIDNRLARLESGGVAFAAGGASNAADIAWVSDEEQGLATATAEGRPVLIDFTAEWCTQCKELEHITFADSRVIDAADEFVSLRVDLTDGDDPMVNAIKEKYGIVNLPVILFRDRNGCFRDDLRVEGFLDADRFLARMNAANTDDGLDGVCYTGEEEPT